MSNTLIVCYSRSGTTLRVAREIKSALDADLEIIGEARTRSGVLGYLRSGLEASARGLDAPSFFFRRKDVESNRYRECLTEFIDRLRSPAVTTTPASISASRLRTN